MSGPDDIITGVVEQVVRDESGAPVQVLIRTEDGVVTAYPIESLEIVTLH